MQSLIFSPIPLVAKSHMLQRIKLFTMICHLTQATCSKFCFFIFQCVASIAAAELPGGQWDNLLPSLVTNIENVQSSFQLKEASLEAIGYICQDIVSIQ